MKDEDIYDCCGDAVERFFITKVYDCMEVEDLKQEVFVRLFEKLGAGVRIENPLCFAIGIAKKLLFEHWRRHGRRSQEDDIGESSIADLGRSPSSLIYIDEKHQLVRSALRLIRLDYQTVLELHYWEHMRYAEIAICMGIPEGTVGTWISSGKKKLREAIERLRQERPPPSDGEPPPLAAE